MIITKQSRFLEIRQQRWGNIYVFICPGCMQTHAIPVRGDGVTPSWEFNGNLDRPTFTPEIKQTYWTGKIKRCHVRVHDGKLTFLDSSDHMLRCKTVNMVEL